MICLVCWIFLSFHLPLRPLPPSTRTPLLVGTLALRPPCSAAKEGTEASGVALCTRSMAARAVAITISLGGVALGVAAAGPRAAARGPVCCRVLPLRSSLISNWSEGRSNRREAAWLG